MLEHSSQDEPAVIFEVLSQATRRIDEGEKRDAYLTIPSLQVYALVEHESGAVVVYRCGEQGFVREDYEGLAAVLPLSKIEAEVPWRRFTNGGIQRGAGVGNQSGDALTLV